MDSKDYINIIVVALGCIGALMNGLVIGAYARMARSKRRLIPNHMLCHQGSFLQRKTVRLWRNHIHNICGWRYRKTEKLFKFYIKIALNCLIL